MLKSDVRGWVHCSKNLSSFNFSHSKKYLHKNVCIWVTSLKPVHFYTNTSCCTDVKKRFTSRRLSLSKAVCLVTEAKAQLLLSPATSTATQCNCVRCNRVQKAKQRLRTVPEPKRLAPLLGAKLRSCALKKENYTLNKPLSPTCHVIRPISKTK
jgi:hypothetical protein